ncbi:hypothetical protein APICC_07040 [Apis cerana cerana]|uniref:Uncharacterized protein n=1 Tax=Apis cerana cerana TaxID=94128 RepID=A0A2A3E5W6_APICC|nr:hypothetical protein APICC_07040 [Apis cerana cerana]
MDEKMKDIEREEIELDKEEEEWQNHKAKIISDLLQRQKMMKAYVATKAIEALHEITQTTIGEHATDIDTTRPKMKMITLSPFLTTDAFEKRLRMLEVEFWEREKWIKELERRLLEREKRFKKDQEDFEKLVREMEETLKKGEEISWPPKTSEPTETIRDCCLRTTPPFSPLPPTERTTIDIREPTITPKKDTTIRTIITEEEKEIEKETMTEETVTKETVTKETVTEETMERLTPKRFVTTKKCVTVLRSKVVGKGMVTERVCVPYVLSKEEEGKTKIATLHLEEHEWTEGPFATNYMTPQTETEEYDNENKKSIEQNRIKRDIGEEDTICRNYQLYNFTNRYKMTTRRIRYVQNKDKDENTKIAVLHLEEHEWTEGLFTTNYMTPQTEIEEVDREETMERERFTPDIDEEKTVCPDPLYKITDDKMKTIQTPSEDEEEKTKLFMLHLKEHEWTEGPFTTDYVTPQTEIEENENENKRSIEQNRFKRNINEKNAVCPTYQMYNATGYKMTTNHLLIDEPFCKYANCSFQLTKSLTITEASRTKSTGKMNWKIDNNRYKVRSMLQIIENEEVENDEITVKQNEWNDGIYDGIYENQVERNLRQEEVTEPWENQGNNENEDEGNDEYKEEEEEEEEGEEEYKEEEEEEGEEEGEEEEGEEEYKEEGEEEYKEEEEEEDKEEEEVEEDKEEEEEEYKEEEEEEYKEDYEPEDKEIEETTAPEEEVIETPMIYTPEEEKPPKKIHEEEEETTEEEKTRQPPGPEWPTEPLTNYHVGGTRTWTLEYPEEKPRKPEDEEEEDFKRVGKRPERTTCYYVVLTKDKKRRESSERDYDKENDFESFLKKNIPKANKKYAR